MGSVIVYSTDKIDDLLDAGVVGGDISGGHLHLHLRDSTTIDVGSVVSAVPDGSTTVKGLVELATDTETATGTDGTRVVTPLGLAAVTASASARGLVELATNAEVLAGTDTVRAVTPAGLSSIPGVKVLTTATVEADVPSAYPVGVSMVTLTTSSWSLNGGVGLVVTTKAETTDRAQQTFYSGNGGTGFARVWVRQYHSTNGGGGWTAWSEVSILAPLTATSFTETTAFTSYPSGWSRLYYTTGNSTAWSFSGKTGEVLTYVAASGGFASQQWTKHAGGSTDTERWIRTAATSSGWSPWRILASDGRLPDPTVNNGPSSGVITATAWANHSTPASRTLVLPYDAIVRVEFGAWLSLNAASAGATVRAGVKIDTDAPDAIFGGTWGNVAYLGSADGNDKGSQHSFSASGKLAAGSHTFAVQAYKTGTATASVNYYCMRITVERWAD